MATMNYEQKYKEAIEKARSIIEYYVEHKRNDVLPYIKEDLEGIFPELKNEDERIRKALVRFHKSTIDIDGIKGEQIIAWLEKQGETYTKKDVDDAYLKGVCDAKQELEKQGEKKLANSAKTCKKSQRMVSAEAKEALYDQPATIDIDKMIDDYANNRERGNEKFGKPLNCMVRAYRQGLNDAVGKTILIPAWSEEDEEMLDGIILRCEKYGHQEQINWLKSIKQRIK